MSAPESRAPSTPTPTDPITTEMDLILLSEKPNQGVLVEFAGFSEDQRRAIRSVLEDKFTLQERENEGRQGLEILDPTITVEDIRSALDAHLSFSIVTENVQAPANRMS